MNPFSPPPLKKIQDQVTTCVLYRRKPSIHMQDTVDLYFWQPFTPDTTKVQLVRSSSKNAVYVAFLSALFEKKILNYIKS